MSRPAARVVALCALLLAAAALAHGCRRDAATPGRDDTAPLSPPPVPTAEEDAAPRAHDVARLAVKGFGEIRIELLEDKAPETVASFAKLAREGFFDGTTFHRVIPGFMIQGGDPNSKNRDPRDDGMGGPSYRLKDEKNDLKHRRGTVSMANTGMPNSAGSQFFICVVDRPDLDGHYTAFGRVVSGMDVVDRILAVPRDEFGRWGPIDRPRENVVVEKVEILPASPADASEGEAAVDEAGRSDAPAPARETPPGAAVPPSDAGPASPPDAGAR